MKKSLMAIALEAEQATGKVNKEIEYVFYARLVDTGILQKATNKEELETIPQLPDAFQDVIYNQRGSQTEEENALIEKLYDEVFLAKNEYLTRETNV